MEQQQGWMFRGAILPVAVRKDAGIGCHVEEALGRRRKPWKRPRPGPCVKRLYVAVGEAWPELAGRECHSVVRRLARYGPPNVSLSSELGLQHLHAGDNTSELAKEFLWVSQAVSNRVVSGSG